MDEVSRNTPHNSIIVSFPNFGSHRNSIRGLFIVDANENVLEFIS